MKEKSLWPRFFQTPSKISLFLFMPLVLIKMSSANEPDLLWKQKLENARSFEITGQFEKALSVYNDYSGDSKQEDLFVAGRVRMLRSLKYFDEAQEVATKYLKKVDKSSVPIQTELAEVYFDRGDFEHASQHLGKVEVLFAQYPAAISLQARMLAKLGKLSESERIAETFLKTAWDDNVALASVRTLIKLKKTDAAWRNLNKVKKTLGEVAEIFYLSGLLTPNPKQKVTLFKSAIENGNSYYDVILDSAKELVEIKEYEHALIALERLAKKYPDDSRIHYNLLLTYKKMGRLDFVEKGLISYRKTSKKKEWAALAQSRLLRSLGYEAEAKEIANDFNYEKVEDYNSKTALNRQLASTEIQNYNVEVIEGESLGTLSKRILGSTKYWAEIEAENNLSGKALVKGAIVRIPPHLVQKIINGGQVSVESAGRTMASTMTEEEGDPLLGAEPPTDANVRPPLEESVNTSFSLPTYTKSEENSRFKVSPEFSWEVQDLAVTGTNVNGDLAPEAGLRGEINASANLYKNLAANAQLEMSETTYEVQAPISPTSFKVTYLRIQPTASYTLFDRLKVGLGMRMQRRNAAITYPISLVSTYASNGPVATAELQLRPTQNLALDFQGQYYRATSFKESKVDSGALIDATTYELDARVKYSFFKTVALYSGFHYYFEENRFTGRGSRNITNAQETNKSYSIPVGLEANF